MSRIRTRSMTERLARVAVVFMAGFVLGCPAGKPALEEFPGGTTICCDGTFTMLVNYKNNMTNPQSAQGSLGAAADFSSLSASPMNLTIPANGQLPVTITGTLKNPCKAGLSSFTMNGALSLTTNITIHDVPFSSVTMPTNPVVAKPRNFTYTVTFAMCPGIAGITIAAAQMTHVTITSITPSVVPNAGSATVTVKGTIDAGFDGGTVKLSATDATGVHCVLKETEIHSG